MSVLSGEGPVLPDDATLVACYVETADDTHFATLYQRYVGKVFRRCLSFCRKPADAEDLTQEVFVKVYLALHRFRGESAFSTWIYRIATNHCLNFLRSRKEFLELTEHEAVVPVSRARDSFRDVLGRVPRAAQALLLLKFRDGYTYAEIATRTGLSESAVKMRISRARAQIMEYKEKKRG